MIEGVPPSRLGTQPIGEVARVADGVYQLKLPVPLPLRFVSVYMIEGGDGWTVVDTGYDYPPTYEAWERAAAMLGIDLAEDVARIVVTHFHPDHLGAARRMQERSGAPVPMLREEIGFSRRIWGPVGTGRSRSSSTWPATGCPAPRPWRRRTPCAPGSRCPRT